MSYVANKRGLIIVKVAKNYWNTSHKFEICVLKTVDEALHIDKKTGADFWMISLEKEMLNIRCAFQSKDRLTVLEDRNVKAFVGFQEIKCHLIFDIKMDGKFICKARFVAGGHTTDPPESLTHYNVFP